MDFLWLTKAAKRGSKAPPPKKTPGQIYRDKLPEYAKTPEQRAGLTKHRLGAQRRREADYRREGEAWRLAAIAENERLGGPRPRATEPGGRIVLDEHIRRVAPDRKLEAAPDRKRESAPEPTRRLRAPEPEVRVVINEPNINRHGPGPYRDRNELTHSGNQEVYAARRDERRGRYRTPDEAEAPYSGTITRGTHPGSVRDERVRNVNPYKSLGADQDRANSFIKRITGG